ncbi:hypothetical protein [Paraburkholderia terrae]|uniref:hypothetical protein n=1 Tax=Paraburkholderia terrae TaxID=311230 RepID=UPI001EE2676D|nr:hypothetical protein [Paraburkholderia terrae]GJH00210.1 hypothetical protein CBA19C8_06655 [Paraburkholderia terrae]
MSMDALNIERLQQLTGERGDKTKAAVRRGDVSLASAPMKSKQLTAAPTMADYNNLQADISRLWNLFAGIAQKS